MSDSSRDELTTLSREIIELQKQLDDYDEVNEKRKASGIQITSARFEEGEKLRSSLNEKRQRSTRAR